MSSQQAEIDRFNHMMMADKLEGNRVIVFHICSLGQIQFIAPIHQELVKRKTPASCWLACEYPLDKEIEALGIPFSHYMTSLVAEQMVHADLFLQTEIWGRGPRHALRVFVGHGQPNKWTNWSDENLQAFDLYFLYGDLERSMFEVIMQSKPESSRHIRLLNIGYPKLDDQMQGNYQRAAVLKELGLDPERKTVIYAPAWDPGGALRTLGTSVIGKILEIPDINVIAKLHPASLEPSYSPQHLFYTGGVDWSQEFSKLESNPRFRYVNDYLINPMLFASDLLVTDFSGVALEFMVLDRPVIYIDCPEFYEKTLVTWGNDPEVSKNDERFNAGRNTGIIVRSIAELPAQTARALGNPLEFSPLRKRLSDRFLYNPGNGSKAAVDAMLQILDIRDVVLSKPVSYHPPQAAPRRTPGGGNGMSAAATAPPIVRRPKVIFTTPIIEHPPSSGPTLRIENTIKALNGICELHLAVRIPQEKFGGAAALDFYRNQCHFFGFTPHLTGSGNPADEFTNAKALVLHASNIGADLIWCGFGNISFHLIQAIKQLNPALKVVCDTDSVWSRFLLRELPFETDPVRRQQIELAGREKEDEEAQWVNSCEVTTAVSEIDAFYYRQLANHPSKIQLFSNVIDVDSYTSIPAPGAMFRSPSLFLAGSFYASKCPMEHAARWMITDILPIIIKALPQITLYIIGSGADHLLADIRHANVEITGKVPSVLPYLCHADVALVPLMFESGTRFKILEAAACSVPVVSTTLGAEGLPVRHEQEILIADCAEDFATAVLRLIADKALASHLARNCNELVRRQFSVQSLAKEAQSIISFLQGAST